MTLPVFRQIRSKRRLSGRGAYTLSDTLSNPTLQKPKYVFVDRNNEKEQMENPFVTDRQITDLFKPTKFLRPVKFETATDLDIKVDNEFKNELEAIRKGASTELAWRYVQNNIKNQLAYKDIRFKPSTISWDGYTTVKGENIYSDIKYLGIITTHTERGKRLYDALQNGWVMMSNNQSNKLRKVKGLGITPIVFAYAIIKHKKKITHKIFQLRDEELDPDAIDQEYERDKLKTPNTIRQIIENKSDTPPPKKRKIDL